jgi:FkbM family methyltransferase
MNTTWIKNLNFQTIIDIGSNEGQFAESFFAMFPDADFFCFEPLPEPFRELQRKFSSRKNFHLNNHALGSESGSKTMFRNEFSQSSSILPMEKLHKEEFVNTEKEFEETIHIRKLDDVFADVQIKRPFLLKIDVQGFEAEVIKGGFNTVSMADMIILETSFFKLYTGSPLFDDIYELLKKMGFEYQGAYDQIEMPQNGRVLQQDAIFTKNPNYRIDAEKAQSMLKSFSAPPENEMATSEAYAANLALASTRKELYEVYTSRTWRVAVMLRKCAQVLIPSQSLRRRILSILWRILKFLRRSLKSKPVVVDTVKRERKINLNSKKIVFVGHSFHAKTLSTKFLIDYLKEHFDVTVVPDESWMQKPFPDMSFVDESYLGVIFFQHVPPLDKLNQIKNDNIIFFPLYDATTDWEESFWMQLRSLKMVSFSKTVQTKLVNWGFDSIYLQYFPKPPEFTPGKADEAFFWQRREEVNPNLISKLLEKTDVKIHMHKAIDPYHHFIQPTREQEKRYKITYSEWFQDKSGLVDVMKGKGIYIAPREIEGIGMSFLEAMAMGKAVVAANNPVLNEYITNNQTGYLYDISAPKAIDLSNIGQVQKNTYEFMVNGFKKWEAEKENIINFIRKT